MRSNVKAIVILAALAGAAAMLAGCAMDSSRQDTAWRQQNDDFGRAVREDLAAQIADPDPAWKNAPPPPSDGVKARLAETRYQQGKVIRPQGATTQTTVGGSSGGGGGSGP